MFSPGETKKILDSFQALVGLFLLGMSIYMFKQASLSIDALILCFIPGLALLGSGLFLLLFGVEVFLFYDDPEIWN